VLRHALTRMPEPIEWKETAETPAPAIEEDAAPAVAH
jgi:hypothetical protein